jgi:hypothetical protein
MLPCRNIPEDLHALTEIVKDTLTSLSNKRMPTITPQNKLKFKVASWMASHNATASVSSLLLEDNIGKDNLSSQLILKIIL